MDPRDRILHAAASLFAEAGFRGATTRRIAEVAAVNEVTLFRHFGSKQELIQQAIALATQADAFPRLPATPEDPRRELTEWSRQQLEHLWAVRSMIRMCMGEGQERPEILDAARDRPMRLHQELERYLGRLRDMRVASPDVDLRAAAAMLMGSLFSDAMGRDFMPEVFAFGRDEAPGLYVDLLLRAIGASDG